MFSLSKLMFRLCLDMHQTGVPNPGFLSKAFAGKLMTAVSPSEINDLLLPERSSILERLKLEPEEPEWIFSPSLRATGFENLTTAFEPSTLSIVPTSIPLWPGSEAQTMFWQFVLPFEPVSKKYSVVSLEKDTCMASFAQITSCSFSECPSKRRE